MKLAQNHADEEVELLDYMVVLFVIWGVEKKADYFP